MATPRSILVPVDFSASSAAALRWALELADRIDATVDVLHVWNAPAYAGTAHTIVHDVDGTNRSVPEIVERQAAHDLTEFLLAVSPDRPLRNVLAGGRPDEVILERAASHDLLVMGTHGRSGLARLVLGSVAEHVARGAQCPVVTVRSVEAPAPAR